MNKPSSNRFAAFDGDRLVALVADGEPVSPEWPDTFAEITDDALPGIESSWLAEFTRLSADAESPEADIRAAAEHVLAVRTEAETRLAAAAPAAEPVVPDPDAEPEPTAAVVPEPDAPTDRDALIAQLAADLTPPAEPVEPPEPGVTREDLVAAVMAGSEATARIAAEAAGQAVTAAVQSIVTAVSEPAPAPSRMTAAELGGYRPDRLAPAEVDAEPRRAPLGGRLVTTADIPGMQLGTEILNREQLVGAFVSRLAGLGNATGVSDEKVPIAAMTVDPPADRDLRDLSWGDARRKVQQVLASDSYGAERVERALTASGGLSAPVAPYYEQLVVAQSDRPVRDDAAPSFVSDRGGIRLVLPPSIGSITGILPTGEFTDGVTSTNTAFTSATAAFVASDTNQPIIGAGIPAGTTITTVTNGTTLVLSAATTATATGVVFRLPSRNPNNLGAPVGIVTAAQDAAGPPTTVKFTYDVPVGSQVEFDVYSVYTSLQYANLTARTFPEQVDAYLRVAAALAARTADSQMLDVMTQWSTLFTGAKTFGTARQLLAQFDHLAAAYRNIERMGANDPLMIGVPAWAINAMRGDYVSSFIGGGWTMSDDELISFFAERNLMPWLYLDGPTDISQLFATTALSAATNAGANTATPTAIPDYPGTGATTSFRTKVISFVYAPGTFINLTTGELNLGLVRDSVLNSQNRFRNFEETWETPAFVGTRALRCVHTVAADGTYGASASITLGVGSGI